MRKSWFCFIFVCIFLAVGVAIGYSADTTGTITAETTAICLNNEGYIVPCDGVPTYQPKYELTFTIKYNKLPADKIRDLIYKIMIEHKDACDVDVKVKKPGSNLIFDSGDYTLPSLPSSIYFDNTLN